MHSKSKLVLKSPVGAFLSLLAIVFAVEGSLTLFFEWTKSGELPPLSAALWDTGIAIFVIAPLLWWTIIKPLRKTALEQRAYADMILQATVDPLIITSKKGYISYYNKAAGDLFQHSAEEMMDHSVEFLFEQNDTADSGSAWDKLTSLINSKDKSLRRVHCKGKKSDGSIFLMEVSIAELSNGGKEAYVTVMRDITAQAAAEIALKSSEEKFREMFESSPIGIVLCDNAGHIKQANDSFAHLVGVSTEKLTDKCLEKYMFKTYNLSESSEKADCKPFESFSTQERDLIHADGYCVPVMMNAVLVNKENSAHSWVFAEDITEQKLSKENLRKSKEQYQLLAEHASDMIVHYSLDSVFLYASPASTNLLGYTPEELVGKISISDLVHPEDQHSVGQRFEDFIHGDYFSSLSYRMVRKDQKTIWVEASVKPILSDSTGELISIQAVVRDITERKEAEISLKENERYLRTIFDAAPIPMLISRIHDGAILFANHRLAEMTNIAAEDLIGKTTGFLYKDPAARDHLIKAIKSDGYINNFEVEASFMSTGSSWGLLSARVVDLNREQVIIAGFVDISERKAAETKLRDSEEFIQQVVNTNPNLIFVKDEQGQFVMANKSTADLFATTVDELISRQHSETRNSTAELQGYSEIDKQVLKTHQPVTLEEKFTKPNGEEIWFQTVKKPLISADGTAHVLSICSDITERKQAEQIILNKSAELEASLRALPDVFLRLDTSGRYLDSHIGTDHEYYPSPEQFMNKTVMDVLGKELGEQVLKTMSLAVSTGCVETLEYSVNMPRGTRYREARFAATHGDQVICIVRDITKRKIIEHEQALLYTISDIANNTEHFDEMLEKILDEVAEFFNTPNLFLALYDKEKELVSFPYFKDENDPRPEPRKKRKGLTEWVLNNEKVLSLTHNKFHELVDKEEIEIIGEPPGSWLGVPLITMAHTFGVLVIQSYTMEDLYDDETHRLMSTVASQLAHIIERKRLEKEVRDYLSKTSHLEGVHHVAVTLQHEINNPLTALLGNAGLMQLHLPVLMETRSDEKFSEISSNINTIVEMANRITQVVHKLKDIYDPIITSHPVDETAGAVMIDLNKSN